MDYKEKVIALLNSQELSKEQKEKLEEIFPELKESEDERTWIINYLHNRELNSTIIAEKKNLKKAIAWLEKQGERDVITFNNAHIIDHALNDYCCKQYDALYKENGGVMSFARLQHLAMDIYAWCKKQGEHKPTNKVEPKFKIGDTIYYNSFGEVKSMVVANVTTYSTDNPMYEDKDGNSVFQNDIIEQKPAWSKDDEDRLDIIFERIERGLIVDKDDIDWLKSLRPQNRWKPSEHEITVLEKIQHGEINPSNPTLHRVIKCLKKLREE